jgi:RHS repeat-associated protein
MHLRGLGTPTCEGTATTPLGYDGQYTSSDTGLIYLQARVYDPATAQFLTVDPAVSLTRAPYVYGGDNPLNYMDRAGLAEESIGEGSCPPGLCFPFPNGKETERGLEAAKELAHEVGNGIESIGSELGNGAESVLSTIKGGSGSERNPAQDKKLTDQEIKELEEAGHHPHQLKPGHAREDLYRDREGNIYTKGLSL